jgi:predicted ATPase
MLAALLGPAPAQFYFFEELESGIHPTRIHLLLQLIEQTVAEGKLQVVATTHSPHLLLLLKPAMQECVSLVYRLEGTGDARISRLLDIPDTRRVLETDDLGHLHASRWFESVLTFDAAKSDEAAA